MLVSHTEVREWQVNYLDAQASREKNSSCSSIWFSEDILKKYEKIEALHK